jgi:hypothetical protein
VGIRYIVMRPGIGLYNRRSPRNGSRTYVARRITLSTASEIVVIAATIVTPKKVLVTADAATWVKASAAWREEGGAREAIGGCQLVGQPASASVVQGEADTPRSPSIPATARGQTGSLAA